MHSMVPLKSLVSDRNHIPSLFVCRSWANVSEFSFAGGALSKRALCRRGSGFPGLFQQLWGVCVVTNLEQCSHQTFSRLRRRLSSLVRLIARGPWGCWACSALSLKASCRRSFLIISMERSFRDSRILLWVPKDGGRPISVIRTTSSWGSSSLTSLSLLQMAPIDLT